MSDDTEITEDVEASTDQYESEGIETVENDGNVETVGKFFLIEVPNYDASDPGAVAPTSYLRLGAAHPDDNNKTSRALGSDLLKYATTKLDVAGQDNPDGGIWGEELTDVIFEDDDREFGGPTDTPWKHLEKKKREEETERLFTKGGWRDHSDGNRISTTRGDKVEVIRGNYKLVVLGRQQSLEDDAHLDSSIASGFDMSGGQMRGLSCNDGEVASTEVKWVADAKDPLGGRWQITEKVKNGDVYERYNGRRHEYYRGPEIYEEVGNEDDEDEQPDITSRTWAGEINEKTWADKIVDHTGSSGDRVDLVEEETWAKNITEQVDVTGAIASSTRANDITENVNATTMQENVNVVTAKMEQVNAGLVMEQVNSPVIMDQVNAGLLVENTNAAVGIVGVTTATGVAEASIVAVNKADITVAGSLLGLDVTTVALELFLGAYKFELGAAATFVDVKATGMKLDVVLGLAVEIVYPKYEKNSAEFSFKAPKVELGNVED